MSTVFDDLLQEIGGLWRETQASRETRLLRIALLRRFVLAIHARRSGFLAANDSAGADLLARLELFIESSFARQPLESLTLDELVQAGMKSATPGGAESDQQGLSVTLPKELLQWLDPAKLARKDRRWEKALAVEAFRKGWSFWQWVVDVEIHQIESWASALSDGLWPRGILLYVETDGFIDVDEANPSLAYWRGRWLMVLEPELRDPLTLSFPLSSWPGTRPGAPGEWRPLSKARSARSSSGKSS